MYITRIERVDSFKYLYVIYNSVKKERFKVEMWPFEVERVCRCFGLIMANEKQVEQMRLNDWKEIVI